MNSQSNSVQNGGAVKSRLIGRVFPLLVFFLGFIFSGILEKMPFLGFFHLLTVIGGIALIAIAAAGRLRPVLRHPIGRWLSVFSAWFVVCIPFSIWKGGSFVVLQRDWLKSYLAFIFVAGAILTAQQSRTIFKTIGYSVGVLSIMTLALNGHDRTGRLGLLNTRYENSNDFGWTLILGLCFLGYFILRGKRREKYLAVFFTLPILLAIAKTGSRATMVGLVVLVLFGILQAAPRLRPALLLAIPVIAALLLAVTPAELRSRYTTFFSTSGKATEQESTAIASAEQRWKVFQDSVYLTLVNPVFGVGPGNFPVAQNDLAISRGFPKGSWMVTHNTYTQVSSEMGIPGLIFYLLFLYQCFRSVNLVLRSKYPGQDWQDIRALANSLRATLIVMTTVALFDAYAYDTNIPIMAGLVCSLSLIAKHKRALQVSTQLPPVRQVAPEVELEPAWTSLR